MCANITTERWFFLCLFFYPYKMKVEHFIKVCVPISNKALQYRLGKGVTLYVDKICDALVLFLVEQYELNGACLIGHIGSLLTRKAEIDKKKADLEAELLSHKKSQR